MTQNQIAYYNYLETVRHNQATEGVQMGTLQENVRHDRVTESQTDRELREKERHDIASETIARETLAETKRHDEKMEFLGESELAEKYRHNTIGEELAEKQYLLSSDEYQLARDKYEEDVRHDVVGEGINKTSAVGSILRGVGVGSLLSTGMHIVADSVKAKAVHHATVGFDLASSAISAARTVTGASTIGAMVGGGIGVLPATIGTLVGMAPLVGSILYAGAYASDSHVDPNSKNVVRTTKSRSRERSFNYEKRSGRN